MLKACFAIDFSNNICEKNLAKSVGPYNLLSFDKYFWQISQILVFLVCESNLIIWDLLKIEILCQTFIFYKNTLYRSVYVILHNFLREHQNSNEIFTEYESNDMVVNENDEQSA